MYNRYKRRWRIALIRASSPAAPPSGGRAGRLARNLVNGGQTVWRHAPLRTPHLRGTDWRAAADAVVTNGHRSASMAAVPVS